MKYKLEDFFNNSVKRFTSELEEINSDVKNAVAYEPELQTRLDKEEAMIASSLGKLGE